MAARLASKPGNLIVIMMIGALLLGYLWNYTKTGQPPALPSNHSERELPDYYLINTSTTRFNEAGQIEAKSSGDKITHYPEQDLAVVSAPFFDLYENGHRSWTIQSNSGIVRAGGQQIDLEQRVIITSDDQLTILKTPAMTVYPELQQAKTDKPVTLINPEGFTRAIGMKADLKQKQVQLLSEVKGQYDIQQPAY